MKLRNKKTGEIIEFKSVDLYAGYGIKLSAESLAELNSEWEDAPEEPKGYWYINEFGTPTEITHTRENIYDTQRKNFGNCFETKEEAEKAVEKLKSFKRLKDKGFRFNGWDNTDRATIHDFSLFVTIEDLESINKDLDLLFCTEENS